MKKVLFFVSILSLFAACKKNETLVIDSNSPELNDLVTLSKYLKEPENLNNYQVTLPFYLKAVGMTDPQISNEKAALGRVLFYDKNLSKDGKIACANCHKPNLAFSDDQTFSTGIEGRKTARNSPPLANVANFYSHYSSIAGKQPLLFWDERASSVEEQAKQTFANDHEMGLTMPEVVAKVKDQEYYNILWKQVYGNTDVQEDQVLECIANFVGSFSACNSKFDKAMEVSSGQIGDLEITVHQLYYGTNDTIITVPLQGFTLSEFNGLKIFVENCSKCHSPIRPFQEEFTACNGLDMQYSDLGIGALSGNNTKNGVFKSPPLRNIALTAPYMHDGRFKTLEEVVNFYSDQVKNSPNLHPVMMQNGSPKRNFTAQQKADLVAFMNTLTDQSSLNNMKYSNPFN
jgi:cytochrome c peroxidase